MNTVVNHLFDLVRIPSISRLSNRPIVEYAVRVLHDAQWHTQQMAYQDAAGVEKLNLIASPPGQPITEVAVDLAFLCHTDTVPYAADWAKALDPFVADGLLYGCGACDVKGFLACLLTAISESDPAKLINGLRLVLTADEEVGCIGASHLMAAGLIRPKRAVIGEPTSLRTARAGKGYCLAEVTIFGQEAHSAHPQEGTSAIYGAAHLIAAIQELAAQLAREQHPFFAPGFTTVNVGTIQGGTAKNVVPGQCTFQLEWRPIPGQSADAVLETINEAAEGLLKIDPRFRYEVKVLRKQAGFETNETSQLVRDLEALTERPATSIPFGSEASLLAAVAEEVVVFGPGDMRTAHSNRECVPISELEETVRYLSVLMHRRAQ